MTQPLSKSTDNYVLIQATIEKARTKRAEGNVVEAAALLNSINEEHMRADGWFLKGVVAREAGAGSKVTICFERALQLWGWEQKSTSSTIEFIALMQLLGESTLQGRATKLVGKTKEEQLVDKLFRAPPSTKKIAFSELSKLNPARAEALQAEIHWKAGATHLALGQANRAVSRLFRVGAKAASYPLKTLKELFDYLQISGDLCEFRGCVLDAEWYYNKGIVLSKEINLPLVECRFLHRLSRIATNRGEFLIADGYVKRVEQLAAGKGDIHVKESKKLLGDFLMSVWEARVPGRAGHTAALAVRRDLTREMLLEAARKCYEFAKATRELIFIRHLQGDILGAQKEWQRLRTPTSYDLLRQGISTKDLQLLKQALSMCLSHGGDVPLIREICHALTELDDDPATYHALSVGLTSTFQLKSRNATDSSLLHTGSINLPKQWVMAVVSVCGTSGLRISRWEGTKCPVTALIPGRQDLGILAELDSIIKSSDETFKRKVVDLKERKNWWAERLALDKRLMELLQQIEEMWLGKQKALLAPEEDNPLILVLGSELQALPWESLPILRNRQVTRMPSVALVEEHLKERRQVVEKGQVKKAFYVLNPSKTLAKTQATFEEQFSKQYCWDGVSSRAPTEQEFVKGLTDYDLFVYCGHGNGEQYLPRTSLRRQIKKVQSVTMLMGCSSMAAQQLGKYDSSSIADAYMLRSCPAVVGTLWDISDADIDHYLKKLLELFVDNNKSAQGLLSSVSQARDACKLKYLTAAAPVVYGLPF